jgi:hypothetical protein
VTPPGWADLNGTQLYFEVAGRGPALLFLHGFTLDRRMWRPQVEALSARFRADDWWPRRAFLKCELLTSTDRARFAIDAPSSRARVYSAPRNAGRGVRAAASTIGQ